MPENLDQVPEGAAVFPLIPEALGVDPLLLAVLHAVVFLDGPSAVLMAPAAGQEAFDHIVGYLRRLEGPRRERVREDLACLIAFARQENWSREQVRFLKDFLALADK